MTEGHPCPCGRAAGLAYADCCRPFHLGEARPLTPELLMRSRYSAFALGLGEYLAETQLAPLDAAETSRWAGQVVWLGLEVLEAQGETVRFVARYLDGEREVRLEETSRFSQAQGRWRYDSGTPTTTVRKVGRNERCPCGSGLKLKACTHGVA